MTKGEKAVWAAVFARYYDLDGCYISAAEWGLEHGFEPTSPEVAIRERQAEQEILNTASVLACTAIQLLRENEESFRKEWAGTETLAIYEEFVEDS